MARILVIEDEDNLRFTIRKALARSGHEVSEAASLREAHSQISQTAFDLIITDVMLGGGGGGGGGTPSGGSPGIAPENGLTLVKELRAEGYDGVVVVITAFSSVDNAVAAMRDGADDYLQKPLSLEELGLQTEKWLEHRRLAQRVKLYERLERTRERASDINGESPAWKATLDVADRLAALPLPAAPASVGSGPGDVGASALPTILLTGETGVGKGVLARYLHQRAVRLTSEEAKVAAAGVADAPFVHVNCSALPTTLVEGELFGHEKGAFTDAREARPGLFEMADGGTIFLDEVSETPLELQAKLLLVVEHGAFRRVGGTKERRVRVRVIAASNQDLDERVRAGAFRRDLLYRLNAFTIRIPPLRERGRDALLIARAAAERLSRRYGRPDLRLSDEAEAAVLNHPWPGNVRELINVVQRAVMLSDGPVIGPDDLGLDPALAGALPTTPPGLSPVPGTAAAPGRNGVPGARGGGLAFDFDRGPHTAVDVEKELVMQALRHTRGNVSRAAKLIGMQRSSLRYRIDRYGLDAYVVEVASL